jgi:hypothetical protein
LSPFVEKTTVPVIDFPEEFFPPLSPQTDEGIAIHLSGDKSSDRESDEDTDDTENATATMAEIHVSQGLIARAIEIYKIVLEHNPDNERIKARIDELQKKLNV